MVLLVDESTAIGIMKSDSTGERAASPRHWPVRCAYSDRDVQLALAVTWNHRVDPLLRPHKDADVKDGRFEPTPRAGRDQPDFDRRGGTTALRRGVTNWEEGIFRATRQRDGPTADPPKRSSSSPRRSTGPSTRPPVGSSTARQAETMPRGRQTMPTYKGWRCSQGVLRAQYWATRCADPLGSPGDVGGHPKPRPSIQRRSWSRHRDHSPARYWTRPGSPGTMEPGEKQLRRAASTRSPWLVREVREQGRTIILREPICVRRGRVSDAPERMAHVPNQGQVTWFAPTTAQATKGWFATDHSRQHTGHSRRGL